MGFNLLSLIMSYPLWTLLCAILFPIIAAIATFVCLRRAKLHRKMLGFFIIIPILVVLIVVFLSDTGSVMTNLLSTLGIKYPPIVGFISAIALGILCLNLTALICGAGLLKKGGAILNTAVTLICLAANIFVIYSTWIAYIDLSELGLLRYDGGVIYIKEVLPFLDSLSFLPDFILESGIELLSLAVLVIYLIVYFLSFIAVKSPEQLVKEDLERRRRAALMNHSNKKKNTRREQDDDDQPDCCACCEHATLLKGDRLHMVCDMKGVVSSSHVCRKFLYDPLKRNAARPLINPLSDSLGDLSGEDHI